MRHLRHNTTPPIYYIDEVIASKRARKDDDAIMARRKACKAAGMPQPVELTYKERCAELRTRNEAEIKKYEKAFQTDRLQSVPQGVPVAFNGAEKDCQDMDSLYAFHSAPMGKLFNEVLSSDGYLNDMCPICQSVKATTFDHYLPQSKYQLFAVHPLNLIPCCTVCNGHKLKNLFDDSQERLFWNAYLDNGTNEQYLFCDISEGNDMPKASFRVEQGNLPERYFKIVKNTFEKLHIDDNYKASSSRIIVGLKDSCCKYYIINQDKGLDDCLQTVADTIPDTGVNDWSNVLRKSLIGTEVFKRFVIKALKQEHGMIIGEV